MGETSGRRSDGERATDGRRFPAIVDWILGGLIVLAGLFAVAGGIALAAFVDRAAIVDGVESGEVTVMLGTEELSPADSVAVTEAVVRWTELGLVVTGAALVVAGVAFVVLRRRAHNRATGADPADSDATAAVIGAVATALFSFAAPVAPVIGGAVAGHLVHDDSGRSIGVGALAGLLPALAIAIPSGFVLAGLVDGLLAVGEGGWASLLAVVLVLTVLFVAVVSAALGAVGGYVGGRLAA
ncbi:DUF5518 domain-containing protein [Halovivax limisalsi]|uniref:DUF5518 domain-containing protein n=1 Tax=Halovivax limisalsi TaxID=1453760 RepID=UPI001FFC967C|nr:DUF5518 domain-containing protein [Halovivax limisalsi]